MEGTCESCFSPSLMWVSGINSACPICGKAPLLVQSAYWTHCKILKKKNTTIIETSSALVKAKTTVKQFSGKLWPASLPLSPSDFRHF